MTMNDEYGCTMCKKLGDDKLNQLWKDAWGSVTDIHLIKSKVNHIREYVKSIERYYVNYKLLHRRFSKEELVIELKSVLSKDDVVLQDVTCNELNVDYCLSTSNDNMVIEIYYLQTRNDDIYITEISCIFD